MQSGYSGTERCFLTSAPGSMRRQEVAERYAMVSGREIGGLVFYYIFGLVKLAVILQQIYYRYRQGLTKDERFAPLILMVGALGMKATEAIERGAV